MLAEPTAGIVEAGCQGTLRAEVSVGGRRAHTARPWTGVNAVHRLAPVLAVLDRYEPRVVVLDGCEYTEQLQAVGIEGGVASNVVPDRATVTVNYRFVPLRDRADVEQSVQGIFSDAIDLSEGDGIEIIDVAPGAPPALTHPVLASLVAATGTPPRAKLGWTDVATFAGLGVPATNFGPGDPLLADTPDEHVSRRSSSRCAPCSPRCSSPTDTTHRCKRTGADHRAWTGGGTSQDEAAGTLLRASLSAAIKRSSWAWRCFWISIASLRMASASL